MGFPRILSGQDRASVLAEQLVSVPRFPQLGLVIPTLHEAANIRTVLQRIQESLEPLGISYQLIVVDDDSRDGTDDIVQEMAACDGRLRFVNRTGQRGLGSAVRSGWELSDAEVLGVIDADLQHPPEVLTQLWEAIGEGRDIVVASRYAPHGGISAWSPSRRLISRVAIWMSLPVQRPDIYVHDPMSGFFLVRRSCLENLVLRTQGFKILLEILVRGKVSSVAEVPFTFGCRLAGRSKAGFKVVLDYLFLLARLWQYRAR
jgi:dolichol-phosphate mannosyltransferase